MRYIVNELRSDKTISRWRKYKTLKQALAFARRVKNPTFVTREE
jgi:hypothetical protein